MEFIIEFRQLMPFNNIYILPGILSLGDIIAALLMSFFISFVVIKLLNLFSAIYKPPSLEYVAKKQLSAIFKKCFELFPNESIHFNGEVYVRGMIIKVTTKNEKTFEGMLVGINNENIIGVLTRHNVSTHILDNIQEINILESKENAKITDIWPNTKDDNIDEN